MPRTKTSNFRKTSKSFYCRVAGTKFIAAINYVRFVLFSLDREWRKNVLEIKIRPAFVGLTLPLQNEQREIKRNDGKDQFYELIN